MYVYVCRRTFDYSLERMLWTTIISEQRIWLGVVRFRTIVVPSVTKNTFRLFLLLDARTIYKSKILGYLNGCDTCTFIIYYSLPDTYLVLYAIRCVLFVSFCIVYVYNVFLSCLSTDTSGNDTLSLFSQLLRVTCYFIV